MTPQMVHLLGTAATLYGLGGALSVLLQARRMYVRGTSDDVSARFFAVYVGGFAVWLLYGLGIGDVPIIVVHAVGLLCGTITLVVTLRLRRPGVEDLSRVRPDRPLPREPKHRAGTAGERFRARQRNRAALATASLTGTAGSASRRARMVTGAARSHRYRATSPSRPRPGRPRVRTVNARNRFLATPLPGKVGRG